MTCALCGHSHIEFGVEKKLVVQHKEIVTFFYGKASTYPCQIGIIARGIYGYRDLYEEEMVVVTRESDDIEDTSNLILKSIFTPGSLHKFRSGIDITEMDLEKSLQTGNVCLLKRNILDIARLGVKTYKKTLLYVVYK